MAPAARKHVHNAQVCEGACRGLVGSARAWLPHSHGRQSCTQQGQACSRQSHTQKGQPGMRQAELHTTRAGSHNESRGSRQSLS